MLLSVKVTAGAKKEAVQEDSKGRLLVFVKEKAERGDANTRVREIFAKRFRVPLKAVRIVAGHQKPTKRILIFNEKRV